MSGSIFTSSVMHIPTRRASSRGAALLLLLALSAQAQTPVPGKAPGEFAVSPSGAATYSIPIQVPPGIAGMEPRLALSYNSQAGNGIVGVGWSIEGLSAITRCPKNMATDGERSAITHTPQDRFCMDGQRLINVARAYGEAGSEYRTEIDSFSKVTANSTAGGIPATGPESFTVKTKAGLTLEYGATADSRIEAQGKAAIRVWALSEMRDARNNKINFFYTEDNAKGEYRLGTVTYGVTPSTPATTRSVVFTYEDRPDKFAGYEAGSKVGGSVRLHKVVTWLNGQEVQSLALNYAQASAEAPTSLLKTVNHCSPRGGCLTSTQFSHPPPGSPSFGNPVQLINQQSVWEDVLPKAHSKFDYRMQVPQLIDVNADGFLDAIAILEDYIDVRLEADYTIVETAIPGGVAVLLNQGSLEAPFSSTAKAKFWSREFGDARDRVTNWVDENVTPRQFVDVNGDGFPDVLGFSREGVRVALNDSGRGFLPSQLWINQFGSSAAAGGWIHSGLYPRFVSDVNGDGLPDIVGFSGQGILVALNKGNNFVLAPAAWNLSQFGTAGGWSDNDSFPRSLIDVTGDGLPDVVGFAADGVYVAVNTGNGFRSSTRWIGYFGTDFCYFSYVQVPCWGAYYTSNNTRPRHFADINGDGLVDIVGFSEWNVEVAFNTGVGFRSSDPLRAEQWPYNDIDVWSSDFVAGAGWPNQETTPRQLADVNNDGLADIVGFKAGRVWVSLNTRTGFGPARDWLGATSLAVKAPTFNSSTLMVRDQLEQQLVDWNGDGVPEPYVAFKEMQYQSTYNSDWYTSFYSIKSVPVNIQVARNAINSKNLIVEQFSNGANSIKPVMGRPPQPAVLEVSAYPLMSLHVPPSVVSSVGQTNGAGGFNTTTYQFGGLRYEHASLKPEHVGTGRGMLGFKWMRSSELATGVETYTEFAQSWPFTGMVTRSETSRVGSGNAGLLKRVSNNLGCWRSGVQADMPPLSTPETPCHGANLNRVVFPYVLNSTESSWDLNGVQMPTLFSQNTYGGYVDQSGTLRQFGDPTQITVEVREGGVVKQSKVTNNVYLPAKTAGADWQLGRLSRATVISSAPDTRASDALGVANLGGGSGAGGGVITQPPLTPQQISARIAPIIQLLLED